MKITYDKEERTVTVVLGPFEEDGTYEKSASGASFMIDGTGGFTQVQEAPLGLKVDAKLIKIIPKAERGK